MSSTVQIDIDGLTAAITGLTSLASDVDSARHIATQGTPVGLPTLSDGRLGKVSAWLADQEPELVDRRDLAILLDKDKTGKVSYTVDADTLENVQAMLGKELAGRMSAIELDTDADDLEDLAELLARHNTEGPVMAAAYDELGPEETAITFANLVQKVAVRGDNQDFYTDLAASMRTGLATASGSGLMEDPHEFAYELSRWLNGTAEDHSQDENDTLLEKHVLAAGPATLAYLLQGPTFGSDFTVGVADYVDHFERSGYVDDPASFYDLNTRTTLTGDKPFDIADLAFRQLSEHPQAALDWLTAETPSTDGERDDRRQYWFNDRDFSASGYGGLADLVDSATTDPDNWKNDRHDAAVVAADFVDLTANSPGFDPEHAKAASPYISHLLSNFMPAVNAGAHGLTDPELAGTDPHLNVPPFGDMGEWPVFSNEDLRHMAAVGMSTDDGLATLSSGVAQFQDDRLNMASHLIGDGNPARHGALVMDALKDDAYLRGLMMRAAGDADIQGAEDAQAARDKWADAVGEVTDILPVPGAEKFGEGTAKKVYEWGVGKVYDAGGGFISDLGDSPDSVRNHQEGLAQQGLDETNINATRSLYQAGLIKKSDLGGNWFNHDGTLKSYDEIVHGKTPIGSYTDDLHNWTVTSLNESDRIDDDYLSAFHTSYYGE